MRKPKQKFSTAHIVLYIFGFLLVIVTAFLLAPYMTGTILDWVVQLNQLTWQDLFPLRIVPETKSRVLLFGAAYGSILLFTLFCPKNYRRGEENGSAKWGDVGSISRKFRYKRRSYRKLQQEAKQKIAYMASDDFSGAPAETIQAAIVPCHKKYLNLILTQNMRLGLDTRAHRRNLNVLVVGGAGSGKSMFYVRPNLLQANTSYIVLDPKGELLEDCACFLESQGYRVHVLNLKNPERSDRYNPFVYIDSEEDVLELVENIFDNTAEKGAQKGEQIWDDSAKSLLRSLIFYVLSELPPKQQNFTAVMDLLRRAKTEEDEKGAPKPSLLDMDMERLSEEGKEEKRVNYQRASVRAYKEYRSGAARTMQSVQFTLNARLSRLNLSPIRDLTAVNEIDLAAVGKEKTVIFAVIPDDTKAYNFLVGVLYTQLFRQLYRLADALPGKHLPIPVHFLMDEFYNVALPNGFDSLLSTMRQRWIFCSIVLQNLTQLKTLYEKEWESIAGNCDSFLYLGGNEQSTHEYVSKLLDKETIDTNTYGHNKGRMSGFSKNDQNAGRELLTPGEVRMLDNNDAIYFLRGEYPIMDRKYNVFHHERWQLTASGGGERYDELERVRRKKAEAKRQRRQAFRQKTAKIAEETGQALFQFLNHHRDENGEIAFDIHDFDFSGEDLLIYAISTLEQTNDERNDFHEKME